MDFDFNLILVPLTAFFFLIWLLDKTVWKQRARQARLHHEAQLADQRVIEQQTAFNQLQQQYPHMMLSDQVAEVDEPREATRARDQLNEAKLLAVRSHQELHRHKSSTLVEWAYDFLPVLAVVLFVRSFVAEPFNIPSESMNPTLTTGDFVLVSKYAFGVRLPLINSKILDTGRPERGDVAVFRYPENPKISFIKRIVGVPGDRIVFKDGKLYVNKELQPYTVGQRVSLPVSFKNETGQQQTLTVQAQQWKVTMGKHQHIAQYILPTQTDPVATQLLEAMRQRAPLSLEQDWSVEVPQGHYFAMGDNRDQSDDSRYWGFVPDENLTGKAVYLWMHKAPGLNWPSFSRNGLIP